MAENLNDDILKVLLSEAEIEQYIKDHPEQFEEEDE